MNLPRISNDGESQYNPGNFIATWDAAMSAIEEGLTGGGGGYDQALLGAGRIVGPEYLSTDPQGPQQPSSPSLTVRLPGAIWFVEGARVEIDDPLGFIILSGVPANQPNGVYGYVSLTDAGANPLEITPSHWSTTLHPEWTAAGLACIGLVKTDASTVLEIVPEHADVILNLPAIKAWLEQLANAAPGPGGTSYWGALQKSATDGTSIQSAIDAAIAAAAGEGSGGTVALPTRQRNEIGVGILHHDLLLLMLLDNAFTQVPQYRRFTFAPGRGDWASLYDADLTTVTLNAVENVIGD